jgi:hypothetical protein
LGQGYDLELMKNIRLIDAWPDGRVVWELDITPFYSNLNGALTGSVWQCDRATLTEEQA